MADHFNVSDSEVVDGLDAHTHPESEVDLLLAHLSTITTELAPVSLGDAPITVDSTSITLAADLHAALVTLGLVEDAA